VTVTIAMPTRNAAATLPQAVASLRNQTHSHWNLIILDDGSTDETFQVARRAAADDSRISVVRKQSSHGIGARLNEILDMTESSLLARMDADDVAYPQRFERQVQYLKENPEVDLLGCAMLVFGSEGRAIGKRRVPTTHAEICRRPKAGFPLFHPTWMGRLDWFRRHRYRPAAMRHEDQDLLLRSYRTSVFANLQEPLLGYNEAQLILKNLLQGRINRTRAVAGMLWKEGHRAGAVGVVAEQFAKGSVDAFAISARLDHRLLRHRASPISEAELTAWQRVWKQSVER
jgi:glycosyltransferase involved in cell wall biosynthesis